MLALLVLFSCGKQGNRQSDAADVTEWELVTPDGLPVRNVDVDTMELPNPFVVYDRKSNMYYMTGDGGYMWTSRNLRMWNGPYVVIKSDSSAWFCKGHAVMAPEIHKYNDRYYYMASFKDIAGNRSSCAVLVADRLTGPYIPVNKEEMLLADEEIAGHPTFCADELNAGYMIYSDSKEPGGELKIIRFTDSLGERMGEAYAMFSGADNALDVLKGEKPVEAPFLFVTDTGMPGLLFTAYDGDESVVAVAYTINEMGHWLNGPWIAEPQPLLRGNVGGASLFTDYDGTLVMALHKDTVISGKNMRVPRFVKMDSQFDKLKKIGYYYF
ncbi:MAG: family 43 glycosylhydrolase [Bacteroidaceae bacterium]|nr:family 43 glycosylhydrolase [Bacteroidaceae bacterium]